MTATPIEKAVGKMLVAFGPVAVERIEAFLEAVTDEHLCPECAVKACREVSRHSKRRPVPADLIEATQDIQRSPDHMTHVADRNALGTDLRVWWATTAPAHVRKVWPELNSAQAVDVAARIEQFGYVEPTEDAIAVELGYVDDYGPTPERVWWLQSYPDLGPAPAPIPSMPRGDA